MTLSNHTAFAIASGEQEAEEEERIEAWQHMLDSLYVWTLPGAYGRMAQSMIEEGVISE